eukprot:g3094.t1
MAGFNSFVACLLVAQLVDARVSLNASEWQTGGPKPQYVGEEKEPDLVLSNALVRDQLGPGLVHDPDVYVDPTTSRPHAYRWKGDADDVTGLSCLFSEDLLVDWRQMKRILYVASYPVDPHTRLYRTLGKVTALANNFGSDRNMTQVTDCVLGFVGTKLWTMSVLPPIHLVEKFFDREEHGNLLTDWYVLALDTRWAAQVASGWAAVLYAFLANMQATMLRTNSGANIQKSIWKSPDACRFLVPGSDHDEEEADDAGGRRGSSDQMITAIDLERVLQALLVSMFLPSKRAADARLKVVYEVVDGGAGGRAKNAAARTRAFEELLQSATGTTNGVAAASTGSRDEDDVVVDDAAAAAEQGEQNARAADFLHSLRRAAAASPTETEASVGELFVMSDEQLALLGANEIAQGEPGFSDRYLGGGHQDHVGDVSSASVRDRLLDPELESKERAKVITAAWGAVRRSEALGDHLKKLLASSLETANHAEEDENAADESRTAARLTQRFGAGIMDFFALWGFRTEDRGAGYRDRLRGTDSQPHDCPLAASFLALAVAHFLYVEEREGDDVLFFWLDVAQRYIALYHELYQFTFSNVMFFRYPIFLVLERLAYAFHQRNRDINDPSILPEECNLVYCPPGGERRISVAPPPVAPGTKNHEGRVVPDGGVRNIEDLTQKLTAALQDDNLIADEHAQFLTPSRYTCDCRRIYQPIRRSQRARLFPVPLPAEVRAIAEIVDSGLRQLELPGLAWSPTSANEVAQRLLALDQSEVSSSSAAVHAILSEAQLSQITARSREGAAKVAPASSHAPMKKMQIGAARTSPICIFMVDSRPPVRLETLDVVEDASYISVVYAVNALYAEQHGYRLEFVLPNEERHYKDRKVGWAKVKIIENQLRRYGPEKCAYGVSIDTDAYFRSSEKLEDIIAHYFDNENCDSRAENDEDAPFDERLAPLPLARDNPFVETERDRFVAPPGPHAVLQAAPSNFEQHQGTTAAAVERQKQRVFSPRSAANANYANIVSESNNNPRSCRQKDVKMLFSLEYHYEEFGRQSTHANGGFWIVKNDPKGLEMLSDWYDVPTRNPERFGYYMKKGHKGLNYCFDEGMMPQYWQNVHFAHPKYFTAPLGIVVRHDWHKKLGNLRHQCREVLLQRLFERDGCIFCNGYLELEYRLSEASIRRQTHLIPLSNFFHYNYFYADINNLDLHSLLLNFIKLNVYLFIIFRSDFFKVCI